jgi:ribose transport system substrate-binding protein
MLLPRGQSLRAEPKKYVFGFSQAAITESWRVHEKRGGEASGDRLDYHRSPNSVEKQVADVQNLIRQGVDVLLISPKEAAALTGAVIKATEAKIPTIIFDRNVDTDQYTQFIGGDILRLGGQRESML